MDFVESFASLATCSIISFRLIESIGIQESINSWFIAVFKESISKSFLVFLFILIKLDSFLRFPSFKALNLSKLLEIPKIKKKIIDTVK
jgi:hypothetical protein